MRRIAKIGLLSCMLACAAVWGQGLPEAIVGKRAAMLPNGGFDIGDRAGHPIAWTVQGDEGAVRVVNKAEDRTQGMASLKIAGGSAGVTVGSEGIVCEPGDVLTLTAKVKGEGKAGTVPALEMEFWDYNRKSLGKERVVGTWGEDWQTVKVMGTAPAGVAHVVVSIVAEKSAGTTYWDEVDLQAAEPKYEPAIGRERELFLDDYRIESAYHVGRVVHAGKLSPLPVVRADKPWEGSAYIYGSVYKIDGRLRMWYTAYNEVAPNYHMAYAESTDGVTWTKPELGLVDYEGSKANNLVPGEGTVAYNPDAPADRRYISMSFKTGKVNSTLGYYVWYSPDGLHWTQASEKPVLFDGDVSNIAYDPVGKQYIATVKKRMFTARTPGIYERTAFISTSADAVTWSTPRIAVSGDYADDGHAEAMGGLEAQIYGMPVSRYESTYVGFPWVFSILNYTDGRSARTGDGPVDVEIASSRDLVHWARPVRDRIIEAGKAGAWDAGAHYCASNILVDDAKIVMYYGAFNNGHGGQDLDDPHRGKNIGQCGMATWRRDGWVSLTNASTGDTGNPGQVTTKPIRFDGKSLHVNAVVREAGMIKVEVLDGDGKAMPGLTAEDSVAIGGDQLDAVVKWKGKGMSDLGEKAVRLRFLMVNADLYSFWVTAE
ncbi:MAG TPA: hypothetical protein VFE58_06035 [Tepidisphaeraceae bacterium]|nr:hypothetical protein [Tepidisphaeraceae bacterium]